MTEEQRRYKIQKKESYEKRSSDKKWEAVRKTFWLGIWGAALAIGAPALVKPNIDIMFTKFYAGMTLLGACGSAIELKGLIEAISKRTMLQGKIEDIETELEMPENEEERGMKR